MERVIDLIKKKILPHLDKTIKINFVKWLNMLKEGNSTDQRLLCCLGIDIKHNLSNLYNLKDIFNKINYTEALSSTKASHFFESALRDNKLLHEYGLEIAESRENSVPYVRIISLINFNFYLFNRIEDIDDVKLTNDKLLNEIKRGQLDKVKMPNEGSPFRKCAWITLANILNNLIEKCKISNLNHANVVIDYLGLTYDQLPIDFLIIEYPIDFNEDTYQPCSINSNWYDSDDNPGLYLSFMKHDKYGRTRSRTEDNIEKRLKERVHKPVLSKYYYSIKHLGSVDDGNLSVSKIGNEALERFL